MRFEWKYSWNSYLFLEQKDNRPNEIIEVTDQKRKRKRPNTQIKLTYWMYSDHSQGVRQNPSEKAGKQELHYSATRRDGYGRVEDSLSIDMHHLGSEIRLAECVLR